MDISDHVSTFAAIRRILKPSGLFVFSILHPCFLGSPFREPDEPVTTFDEDGEPVAYSIRRYSTEGFWESGGDGIRGRVGSYHRTVSTYVNALIEAGFTIARLLEPVRSGSGLGSEVPGELVISVTV